MSILNKLIKNNHEVIEKQYKSLVVSLVRKKYSQDDEIAIIRQQSTKPDEFEEYNTYVEECKAKAKESLSNPDKPEIA